MPDDWSLTAPQLLWMAQHHNAIEDAYASDDMRALTVFAQSDDFRALFGDMSWDEAYDRYECMGDPPTLPDRDF